MWSFKFAKFIEAGGMCLISRLIQVQKKRHGPSKVKAGKGKVSTPKKAKEKRQPSEKKQKKKLPTGNDKGRAKKNSELTKIKKKTVSSLSDQIKKQFHCYI